MSDPALPARPSPLQRLKAYAAHPDPLAESCNWIALVVASNQPIYPLYLLWIVGGDWWISVWTFLSTPFFLAVPAVARRHAAMGRALLPLAGIGNGIVSAKAFGVASGVELFLVACSLIGLLAFRRGEGRWTLGIFAAAAAALLLHDHYGPPLGRFDAGQYAAFFRLNAYSVAGLCFVILWSLGRLRLGKGRPVSG
ncbi:hypothetical protein [Rhizorhabdus dicambivorans]|uniref:Uncharacterized protein n=1 Tax=Rhizorhabdus dicambivorans TaxID=1850238 RepID=A0A2A4G1F8_9SPHN|nr:hypothetical protein [Rhizorhabdus dicambivorans]ATE63346.1 hypothetical protein CMV14_02140 [Rhizorhabdus dicambivorans]PCE43560.1 hypothetical protein COO09_04460 [Rhizorhabdus dicambivorans]